MGNDEMKINQHVLRCSGTVGTVKYPLQHSNQELYVGADGMA